MRPIREVFHVEKSTTSTRNTTPNPGPLPKTKEEDPYSWLCDSGPYQKYIAALSRSNPGLKKADPNNKGSVKHGNAQVVLLDVSPTGPTGYRKRQSFKNSVELNNHFQAEPRDHDRRHIYLMEGMSPDYVSVIGGRFFMDPTFFMRQERTCVWSNDFTPVSDSMRQPSLLNPKKSFHLQYCELRQFDKALENRYYFCERTRRHVGMTAPRSDSTIGILRRKIGWWCKETANGGWDVVVLCDPQLVDLSPSPKQIVRGQLQGIDNTKEPLKNTSFQDGYVDFVPSTSFESEPTEEDLQNLASTGPMHLSMLEDLVHYYTHHFDPNWQEPSQSALFVKKIVASHYLQLVDYIKIMLPSLELRLTTAWVEEQDQWKSLQTISRRCGNYRDDIEEALLSLGHPLDGKLDQSEKPGTCIKEWNADCERDLQYAYFRLRVLKERADNLTTSMTGLASIAGNRQNLEEAKRVKRLNLLALLFIPLAYTSSLFSMQDNYAPNKPLFWVYWVTAIGVVFLTSCVTFVMDRALDDEANWTLAPIRYLKFWGKEQEPGIVKTKTGLFKV
ncbi:hypothetical protein GQ44DRAFT_766108 [Phaeosphaeriaceae sp. PMI808]|nr:hypothetical protein GQ44DRAFT_766108 [Phaeosphaeriaceae sp. PMI808]